VKLVVPEPGSDEMEELVTDATATVTSRISYVETRAAVARARRDGRLTTSAARRVVADLDVLWGDLVAVEVDEHLAQQAATLVDAHPLRAGDALQLASAMVAAGQGADVVFACWDARLWAVARDLGFRVVPGSA
jgi:predicted nucleic acid-binding protein